MGGICIFIENKIVYDFSDWNKLLVLRIYKNHNIMQVQLLTTQVRKFMYTQEYETDQIFIRMIFIPMVVFTHVQCQKFGWIYTTVLLTRLFCHLHGDKWNFIWHNSQLVFPMWTEHLVWMEMVSTVNEFKSEYM